MYGMAGQTREIGLYNYQHLDDSELTSNIIIIVTQELRDSLKIWWKSVGLDG
jgi:hypothetical protein